VQLRGLEYSAQTLCHQGEAGNLQEFANDPSPFRRANRATVSAYELRALAVQLRMYDVAKSTLEGAFIAVTPSDQFTWFMFAFCRVAAKGGISVADLQPLPSEYEGRLARAQALEPQVRRLFELFEVAKSPDESERLTLFWGAVLTQLFSETGLLQTGTLVAAFKGDLRLPAELSWVYSVQGLFKDVVSASIRLGVACTYLASALYTPTREQFPSEDEFLREVVNFFHDIDRDIAAVAMGTPDFEQAFFEGQRPLLTLEEAKGAPAVPTMMRFALAEKDWAVFKIDQELVKGLWANEIRDILFWEQNRGERLSISMNPLFLNNMVLQSCDSPIGYPALTSPVIESLVNPWTI
jgi:hypothetical protein